MMKWIVATVALLVLAVVFDLGLLVYAVLALVAILSVAGYVTALWSGSVRIDRRISSNEANVGDRVHVGIEIENTSRWPITWMLVEDLIPVTDRVRTRPALTIEGESAAVLKFSGNQKIRLSYNVTAGRRGFFQIGPTVVETGDMFGFHRQYRVLSEPFYLLIYPHVVPLGGYDIASKRPIGDVIMTNRLFEDPTRIAGVRDYQLGDPLNRIHWKKSASTGKLQSKISEPSVLAGATILIDFHVDSFDRKQEPIRSELAVTAAASIAHALMELGQQVGLVSNGRDAADRIRVEGWVGDHRTRADARSAAQPDRNERLRPTVVPTRRGVEQSMRILRSLSRLEQTDGMTFAELILDSATQLPRDATVLAILTDVTMQQAVALGSLKKQGYSVSALINTFDDEWFARLSGLLLAEGIQTAHLKEYASIPTICEKQALMK